MDLLRTALARARLTPLQMKVFDATNAEPWGPHGTVLSELARSTNKASERDDILALLSQRLSEERPEQWRCVYKALTCAEFLVANGSEAVVLALRSSVFLHKLDRLMSSFHFKEPDGTDQGINVRHKSKALSALLQDSVRTEEIRAKAAANRNKYAGVSSSEMRRQQPQPTVAATPQQPQPYRFDDETFSIRDTAWQQPEAPAVQPKFRVQFNNSAPPRVPAAPPLPARPAVPMAAARDPFATPFDAFGPPAPAPRATVLPPLPPPLPSLLNDLVIPSAAQPATQPGTGRTPLDDLFGLSGAAAASSTAAVDPFAFLGAPTLLLTPTLPPVFPPHRRGSGGGAELRLGSGSELDRLNASLGLAKPPGARNLL